MVKNIIQSFSFMILLGIVLGLLLGGFPILTEQISTSALFLAMTLSLTHINIRNIQFSRNQILLPLIINYGLLSSVTIVVGSFFPIEIFYGFVVIASVPPAIAIIPVTKILQGDVEYALISLSFLYIVSLILTPLLLFVFLGETISVYAMLRTIVLLLIIPIFISQFIRKYSISTKVITPITNFCFFILIFTLVGKNREYLFQQYLLILLISLAIFIRTFGTGTLISIIASKLKINYEKKLPMILFGSVKNEGYAIILAFSLIGGISVLPAIIAIIFEMMLISFYEQKFW